MPILCVLSYNGSLITLTIVSLTTAKFKSLIFSTSGFTCPIPWTCSFSWFCMFSLLPTQFCYIIVYIWKAESCVEITDWCAPWKISNGAKNLVLHALQWPTATLLHNFSTGFTENTASNSFYCYVHILCLTMDWALLMSLPSHCLAMENVIMSQY
jgi:hypothetical protein